MHERVRREFWGYAPDETLTPDQLILEQYHGIRPAPGYPAQPDHTEKATLFELLDAENTAGVKLTESFAMWPGSSVSGLYFSHPESRLFRRRQDRARPGRGLRRAQGLERRGSRALAGAGAELHPGAGSVRAGPPRQGGDADAGAGRGRARQRRRRRIRRAATARCIWPSARRRRGVVGRLLFPSPLVGEGGARTRRMRGLSPRQLSQHPSPVSNALAHSSHPLPQGERGRVPFLRLILPSRPKPSANQGRKHMFKDLFSLKGRVALVTGRIARHRQDDRGRISRPRRAKVYITARKAGACKATAKELPPPMTANASRCRSNFDDRGRREARRRNIKLEPKLDILVNNAGRRLGRGFRRISGKGWDKVMDLNVKTPFFLTKALATPLRAAASARTARQGHQYRLHRRHLRQPGRNLFLRREQSRA